MRERGREREAQRDGHGGEVACFNEGKLVIYMLLNWEFINITVYICTISEQNLQRGNILCMESLFIPVKVQNKN